MNFTRSHTARRWAVLGAAMLLATPTAFAQCGLNTPAMPVEEFRQGTRVWPSDFRPGLPGQTLNSQRDSTNRFGGIGVPGAKAGTELFKGVDVVDDVLFTAYNAGVQVWSISGSAAEDPVRQAYADGFEGHWLSFPGSSEQLNFVEDVSVGKIGQTYVIGASGKVPVGVSIWTSNGGPALNQKYQDIGSNARQVRIVEDGGNLYMIGMIDDGSSGGVAVWDATAAANRTAPCIDSQGSVCPGVFLGFLPNQFRGRYLDAISWNGAVYIATGDQFLNLELWKLSNPAFPATAQLLATGDSNVRGPAFVPKGNDLYLSYVNDDVIKFFDITTCTDGNGCAGGFGSAVKQEAVAGSTEQFLTFSTSGDGTPYVYYGVSAFTLEGDQVEKLLDVSALGTSGPLVEITATGGTYTDPCNGLQVDYWGDYYQDNHFGLNAMHPRIGKFSGNYFYRAAQSILDVHVKGGQAAPDPTVTVTVDNDPDQPPYYFGDGIAFDAVADNCAGAETWTWFADDTDATGLGSGGPQKTITWNLCGASSCPDKTIEVWATKAACAGASNLQVNGETITVVDPRPEIQAIDVLPGGGVYPVCTLLTVSADVDGRNPIAYSWQVRDQEGDLLTTSNQATFVWDTSNVDVTLPPLIFNDSFESGTLGNWSSVLGGGGINPIDDRTQSFGSSSPEVPQKTLWDVFAATKAEQIEVDITLTATNQDATDTATETVTITTLGTLEIGSPAITAVPLGDAAYRLTATTLNATEWRWIVEDPANGSTTNCGGLFARCEVFEFGEASQVLDYQWATPNTDGVYGIYVEARNCIDLSGVSGQRSLNVTGITDPVPPTVLSFQVDLNNSPSCSSSLGFIDCDVNQPITFQVTYEGGPTNLEFDWEADGVYEDVVPAGVTVTHSYNSLGPKVPRVRASKGSAVSGVIWLSGSLTIVP